MKSKIAIFTILLCCLFSCRSVREIPVAAETVIRERVVPVAVPADSATVKITLRVDTLTNEVGIAEVSEAKTQRVETRINLRGNDIEISFKAPEQTIRVPVSDTTRTIEKAVVVEVEKKANGKWTGIIWAIVIAVIAICVTVILSMIFRKK
jgi:hypothetical protein